MAELQEQLQAILGDPEAMGQITAIARALSGGIPPAQGEAAGQDTPPQESYVPVDSPPQEDAMPDLSALLGLLGGKNGPDLDPRLVQTALKVCAAYSAQDDERAALLAALKPFLKEERLEKMERAEKAARLSRVVRVVLELLKEDGHV